MFLQDVAQTNSNSKDLLEGSTLIVTLLPLIVTLLTLILSSYFAYRSAKASEKSANSAEEATKLASESAKIASSALEEQQKHNDETLKIQKNGMNLQQLQYEESLQFAENSLQIQREHNYKTVLPILLIEPLDHDEEVSVKLYNNGIGPAIITNIEITNGIETNWDLISWMPKHPKNKIYWTTFRKSGSGRVSVKNNSPRNTSIENYPLDRYLSILPEKFVSILLLENQDLDDPDFVLYRHEVRKRLSKLSISISYMDVYKHQKSTVGRDLSWFGRTIHPDERNDFKLDFDSATDTGYTPEEWDKKVTEVKEKLKKARFEKGNSDIIIIKD
jgi:hypothetical protein